MTNTWIDRLARCRYNPRVVPIILAFLRVAICLWPQKGYMHPDEFFQSSDFCAGRYFESQVQPVWEFQTDKPIRNMLIPTVFNSVAFYLVRILQKQPSAYLLLVAPRLIYTISTFIIDFCLYKLCQYYSSRGLWYLPISIIFQSSFICLGCLTRTFNNVTETIIFAVFLVVVCQIVRPTFRIYFVTPARSTPINQRVKKSKQLVSSLTVGAIVTLGVFNRPTFLCFAIVPIIYWLSESWKRNSYDIKLSIQRVIVPLAVSAFFTALLMSAFDTIYYKNFDIMIELLTDIINLRFSIFYQRLVANWILTPYNFIVYNTNPKNLIKFGLHAPYLHFLVNIPLAFNILGLLFYIDTFEHLIRSRIMRIHRIHTIMLLTTLASIILLSFIPHQEFRFLLPLIVPMTYVFSFKIYTSNRLLGSWLILNLVTFIFYACIHQAGPISVSLDLGSRLQSHLNESNDQTFVNVIGFKSYLVPTYHWNIPKADQRFHIDVQDIVDDFYSSLDNKLRPIMDRMASHQDYKHLLYIMLPQFYVDQLANHLKEVMSNDTLEMTPLGNFAPHFSSEEFHNGLELIRKEGISEWKKAFGFTLIRLDLSNYIPMSST